jgi:hypothetical protein
MTEKQTPPQERLKEPAYNRSGWGIFAKVLLYVIAGSIVLILVVFGTCVLSARK